MRAIGVLVFAALFILLSCNNDADDNGPTDPKPVISYKDISFNPGDQYVDTLILTIAYADGDQDLGLAADEISAPYHYTNYFLAGGNGDTTKVGTKFKYDDLVDLDPTILVKSGEKSDLITYRTRLKPGYDFLPPYEPPYSCLNYRYDSIFVSAEDTAVFNRKEVYIDRILKIKGKPDVYVLKDTFYYEVNPHATNIHVDIFVEKNAGTFELFEAPIDMVSCIRYNGIFSGKFPRIDDLRPGKKISNGAFTITGISPWQGEIRYKIVSLGLIPFFGGKRIKVRINIEDRALHVSNAIETEPFEIPSK